MSQVLYCILLILCISAFVGIFVFIYWVSKDVKIPSDWKSPPEPPPFIWDGI